MYVSCHLLCQKLNYDAPAELQQIGQTLYMMCELIAPDMC